MMNRRQNTRKKSCRRPVMPAFRPLFGCPASILAACIYRCCRKKMRHGSTLSWRMKAYPVADYLAFRRTSMSMTMEEKSAPMFDAVVAKQMRSLSTPMASSIFWALAARQLA